MADETKDIVSEGLRRALMEAAGNLYRVFTSVDRGADHEQKFVNGINKQTKDYERMLTLLGEV